MEELRSSLDILREEVSKFNILKQIEQLEPLPRAVVNHDFTMLEDLLRHGEDPDDEDETHYAFTAAHWAAVASNHEILNMLYDYGTNMSAVEENDMTPLHVAALAGNSGALIWLLENTYDIEAKEEHGQTPLHQAALNGHLEAAKILVEYGASMEATDISGMTPICLAAVRGFAHVVNFFLLQGANPAVRDVHKKTLLHASAAIDDIVTMSWLLKQGIDVNCKDSMNCTPLHDAAKNDCCRAISFLLQSGANKKATDFNGCTPLYRAKEAGHVNSIELLMDKDKDHAPFSTDYIIVKKCNDLQNGLVSCVNANNAFTKNSDALITDNVDMESSSEVTEGDNVVKNCDSFDDSISEDKSGKETSGQYSEDEESFKNELDYSSLTFDDIKRVIF